MKFTSLQEGLHYYTTCPLCHYPMQIENIGLKGLRNRGNLLGYVLQFSLDYDDKLIVNPVTEEVIIVLASNSDFNVNKRDYQNYHSVTYKNIPTSPINYNGTMYYGVGISCSGCNLFYYAIQLALDLNNRKLLETNLSKIKVGIKDKEVIHEITSFSGSAQTIYSTFDGTKNSSPVVLPLMNINIENPKETLNRIQKLLPFI